MSRIDFVTHVTSFSFQSIMVCTLFGLSDKKNIFKKSIMETRINMPWQVTLPPSVCNNFFRGTQNITLGSIQLPEKNTDYCRNVTFHRRRAILHPKNTKNVVITTTKCPEKSRENIEKIEFCSGNTHVALNVNIIVVLTHRRTVFFVVFHLGCESSFVVDEF